MKHELDGASIHIATGGLDFDPARPVLVFIHGSGQSHLTWVLQTRYFAHRGFAVLAPDLPGHGLSGGAPLTSIGDMADWIDGLLASLCVAQATLVGHSQGVLVALETASRHPERVAALTLIAGAMAIPVNDALIEMSQSAPEKAFRMMTSWGHGPGAHKFDNTQPGHAFLGYGRQVMAHVSQHAILRRCPAAVTCGANEARPQHPPLLPLSPKPPPLLAHRQQLGRQPRHQVQSRMVRPRYFLVARRRLRWRPCRQSAILAASTGHATGSKLRFRVHVVPTVG